MSSPTPLRPTAAASSSLHHRRRGRPGAGAGLRRPRARRCKMKLMYFLMDRDEQREKRLELEFEVSELETVLEKEQRLGRVLQCSLQGRVVCHCCLATLVPTNVRGLLGELAMVEDEIFYLEKKVEDLRLRLRREQKWTDQCIQQQSWPQNRQPRHPVSRRELQGAQQLPKLPFPGSDEALECESKASVGSASAKGDEVEHARRSSHCKSSETAPAPPPERKVCMSSPNKLSEELIRLMVAIFHKLNKAAGAAGELELELELSGPSSKLNISCIGPRSLVPRVAAHGTAAMSPLKNRREKEAAAGCRRSFVEFTRASVDASRISLCLVDIKNLRGLMQKLSTADPSLLTNKQKLAFWINIYNFCVMHAFLQHGLPPSPEKLLALLNQIQINQGDHNCASTQRVVSKMANIGWVAERAIPLLKRDPQMGAKELQEELNYKYQIEIPYQTVYNGRQRAADKLFGKWDDSFDWLYRFKAEIELRSPGSVIEIATVTDPNDGKIRFSRFFCAFKASIDGFLNGCRPYLSIDSTALNGMWNGHMPAALGLDGHNWMFPVAFGLFDSEDKENWIWFMEQLRKAIGPMDKLAICTDACKGLESSVKAVFPHAEMRECFRHLMDNMKKYYTGDVYDNMWPAARAYSAHKFKYFFDKVLEASPDVQKWLTLHHPFLWARSKFSDDIKCDYINNNLAEAWNSWIKEHKDLPVHCMADAIREKIMILFAKRRKISRALPPGILPGIIHQLNAASRGLGHLKISKGHPDQAEVTEVYKDEEVRRHVVYLSQKICTCRQWQITGQPCPHALAVITSTRQPNMGKFVDHYYSVQKFQSAYDGIIPNITDRNQWPEVEKGFKLYPPCQKKRTCGRLRKNRIKSARETGGKATRQVRCPNCTELGHRAGSWRCPLTGTKKRKRTKKTKAKAGRKKSKKDTATEEPTTTPRTRAAVAREAAEKARKEAMEAELKAASAREAAEAAARQEREAARLAASTSQGPEEEHVMALEVVLPEATNQTTTTRRSLFPGDALEVEVQAPRKMTPKKKKLATKVKKTPQKKGATKKK